MKDMVVWILKGIAFFALAVICLFLPLSLAALALSGLAGALLNKELFFTLQNAQWWTLLGLYALVFGAAIVFVAVKGTSDPARRVRAALGSRVCARRGHVWAGYLCSRCGAIKPHEHDWDGCRCKLCGEIRDEGHDWIEHDCPRCNGTGYVLPECYASSICGGPDYREPCGCEHPVEYECRICGRRTYCP